MEDKIVKGMVVEITRPELERIMSNSACGITRWFGEEGCPCDVDDTVKLINRADPSIPESQLVALARIRAIRPHRIGDRQNDKEMLKLEGYESFAEWENMFREMYGRSWDGSETLHCLYLILEDRTKRPVQTAGKIPMIGR